MSGAPASRVLPHRRANLIMISFAFSSFLGPAGSSSAGAKSLRRPRLRLALAPLAAGLLAAAPNAGHACACGCGVFSVATSSMLPLDQGGMAYLEYDFQNQNHNWSGRSAAPAADNPDQQIETDFYSAGLEYMANRSWGLQFELPYDRRSFRTTGGPTGDDPVSLRWSGPGDVRLKGIYTGFSPDLSVGLTFGVKLPTGSSTHNDVFGDIDRDSELGTGSTDLLLGGLFRHQFAADPRWAWFAQAEWDQPVLIRDQYRPGAEVDAAAGIYFDGWSIGAVRITPVGQVIASGRARDSGSNAASPVASGFRRFMLSPGLEMRVHQLTVYADAERPVYQHFTGDQLAAPVLFKVIVSRTF